MITYVDPPEIELADVSEEAKALGHLVAVHDGAGDSSVWCLFLEDAEEEVVGIIKWPKHWPNWVDSDFLQKQGFRTTTA